MQVGWFLRWARPAAAARTLHWLSKGAAAVDATAGRKAAPTRSRLTRYALALTAAVLAAAVSWTFYDIVAPTPTLPFVAAVALTAWYAGHGPAALVVAAGGVVVTYLFVPPAFAWGMPSPRALFTTAGFVLIGTLITVLTTRLHSARVGAEEAAHEARQFAQRLTITNRSLREAIQQRDQAVADLEATLRIRDEFLASVSHDLKNPLTSVKATVQLLQRRVARPAELDLEALATGLARVDATITQASNQVDELLDLTRLQMGRPLELEARRMDLVGLVRETIADMEARAETHHIQLEATEPVLEGVWDPSRLRRVLANLIENGLKYSPAGGSVTVRVRRERADSGERALIEVEDQGVGIPAEDLPHVFERFRRGSNVVGRIGGTGIGLASVKHIVDAHGGSVEIASQPGRGTRVRVCLPVVLGELGAPPSSP
ncbi:MAG: ATP-binding protein [Chloroflexota bacterium]|nr:ATP-binding protein [Chloroflexota bacterium]